MSNLVNLADPKYNCSKKNSNVNFTEGAPRNFDRFVLGEMATPSLYDCANNQGSDDFERFQNCFISWMPGQKSYEIFHRNGSIKKSVPLTARPPLEYCDIKPKRNYSFYS